MRSKCLSQGNEKLRGFDSRRSIQVVAHIKAHGAERSGVPKSYTNRVGVKRREVVETNTRVDVPTVIESCEAQISIDRRRKRNGDGNSQLRIDD